MARSLDDLAAGAESDLQPHITLTAEARAVVKEALADESEGDRLALWLEIKGVQGTSYAYDLYFQPVVDAGDQDLIQHDDELPVVVPAASVDQLRGARLEWSEEGEGGLVLVNPNSPASADVEEGIPEEALAAGLGGPLAAKVVDVLDRLVNPSIASHGGRADLAALDEGTGVAYLRLSGGCQGCAMSRMTLTQGIEVALKEELPELVKVVDVTDHADGANPYY